MKSYLRAQQKRLDKQHLYKQKRQQRVYVWLIVALLLSLLMGCGGESTPVPISTPPPIPTHLFETSESEPELNPFEGMVINPLSGLWIEEALAGKRPMAYVINNLPRALPQSGISQADIIYEVLAEGGITRLVAIFTDTRATMVGPIRSTRDYFAPLAINHGAVLVHHGGSPSGYSALRNLGLENLDGMALEGTVFWRDQARWNAGGMREHSSYTNHANVRENMESRGLDLNSQAVYVFNFFEYPTTPTGHQVRLLDELVLPFSQSHRASFVYDPDQKLFYRYQRGQAHWDEYTDSQLMVANIIVKHAPMHVIAGDAEGRMQVNLTGNGTGYLVTAGTYAPITWSRTSDSTPTVFLDSQGEPLTLNPGMTWIGIVGMNVTPEFLLHEEELTSEGSLVSPSGL